MLAVKAWDTGSLQAGHLSGVSAVPSGKWGTLAETSDEVSVEAVSLSRLSRRSRLTGPRAQRQPRSHGLCWGGGEGSPGRSAQQPYPERCQPLQLSCVERRVLGADVLSPFAGSLFRHAFSPQHNPLQDLGRSSYSACHAQLFLPSFVILKPPLRGPC